MLINSKKSAFTEMNNIFNLDKVKNTNKIPNKLLLIYKNSIAVKEKLLIFRRSFKSLLPLISLLQIQILRVCWH